MCIATGGQLGFLNEGGNRLIIDGRFNIQIKEMENTFKKGTKHDDVLNIWIFVISKIFIKKLK